MKSFNSFFNNIKSQISHGFTLVEFVVIIGIFAIMVSVIMSNFNGFKSVITLDNLAQDIALAIRQVQTSAGAAQSLDGPEQAYSRGIVFTPNDGAIGGYKSEFTLYETRDINGVYDPNSDRLLDTIKIQTTDKITGITYIDQGNLKQPLAPGESVYISFKRFITNATVSPYREQVTTCIELASADSSIDNPKIRSVCVSKLGQISVR
jgi:type II secretory pathway pseudopilin PulG